MAGLFAQAGVAEETLFRGYLFGCLRRRFPFWRAWFASMVPFVAVHLFLFLTMPWPVATAAVLLAATTSIPLSHLYELGGRTIWAPALLHFTIQSVPKIFIPADSARLTFPLTWMAVCGTLPLLVLLIRVRPSPRSNDRACSVGAKPRPAPHSPSVVTQAFDGREQVARPFTHKGRCSDVDGSLPDVRIVHRREHDNPGV